MEGLFSSIEISRRFLDSEVDILEILAACSTKSTGRDVNLEVLEFAGDVYWKIPATLYHYHASCDTSLGILTAKVSSITDNIPLHQGLQDCGAAAYLQTFPLDPTSFLPQGCGLKDTQSGKLTYLSKPSVTTGFKRISDMGEALLGAVGQAGSIPTILRTCAALQMAAFPSVISLSNRITLASEFPHNAPPLSDTIIDAISQAIGYHFRRRDLLELAFTLGRSGCSPWARMMFLGEAVFSYVLVRYMMQDEDSVGLDPHALTEWRKRMLSGKGMSLLIVSSGICASLPGEQRQRFADLVMQVQGVIQSGNIATMMRDEIKAIQHSNRLIYALFGAIVIDNEWEFARAHDVFSQLYLNVVRA